MTDPQIPPLASALGLSPATPGDYWALLPCAGTGSRAVVGPATVAALPKQYQSVAGHPMVLHTLAAFAGVSRLRGTLVAVAPGDHFLDAYPVLPISRSIVAAPHGLTRCWAVCVPCRPVERARRTGCWCTTPRAAWSRPSRSMR